MGQNSTKVALEKELRRATAALQAASLRLTQSRVAILKALISDHGPFSVDELLTRGETRSLDRVTLYRCLLAFEEIGLVRRCEFGDGVSRYEYCGGGHHHHHVICKKCRAAVTVEGCISESLLKSVQSMGFTEVTHSLEFFGLCRKCQ